MKPFIDIVLIVETSNIETSFNQRDIDHGWSRNWLLIRRKIEEVIDDSVGDSVGDSGGDCGRFDEGECEIG